MPIEFEDATAKTMITRRVLMLCDRWSDWSGGRAIINQLLALGLCTYGAVEVYRSDNTRETSSVAAGFGRHGMPPPVCNPDF